VSEFSLRNRSDEMGNRMLSSLSFLKQSEHNFHMISFRDFIERLRSGKKLVELKKPVSKNLEIAGLMHSLDGRPVYVQKVMDSDFPAAGNLFSTR
jgi:hypothetical protein